MYAQIFLSNKIHKFLLRPDENKQKIIRTSEKCNKPVMEAKVNPVVEGMKKTSVKLNVYPTFKNIKKIIKYTRLSNSCSHS